MHESQIDVGVITSVAPRSRAEQVDAAQIESTLGLFEELSQTLHVVPVASRRGRLPAVF